MRYIVVAPDPENNAEAWWDAARQTYPTFCAVMQREGAVAVAEHLWGEFEAMAGFSNGPAYARTALIDCGPVDPYWLDSLGRERTTFEKLS